MIGVRRPWRAGSARYRTVDEGRIVDLLSLAGWADAPAPGDDALRRAVVRDTIDRLVNLGLPVRVTPDGRAFDPAEVINFTKSAGLEGRDRFWSGPMVEAARLRLGEFGIDRDGVGNSAVTRRFIVTLRRTFNLAGIAAGKALRLRLPLLITQDAVRDVSVEVIDSGGLPWRIAADGVRLEAHGPAPPGPTVTLAVRLGLTTTAPGRTVSVDQDLDRYLHPNEGTIAVTPRVAALAARLVAGARTDREAVARLWNFMLDHLACGAVHYDQIATGAATDWVLETGWFDCYTGGALLVALCRAQGIPARLMSGFHLYRAAATIHSWTEIWLDHDGWRPFDLLAWDLSSAGRDLAWRACMAGRIDPRLTTQCLPLLFTGAPGVAIPAAWHLLTRRTPHGTESGLYDVATGALAYRDEVDVACAAD